MQSPSLCEWDGSQIASGSAQNVPQGVLQGELTLPCASMSADMSGGCPRAFFICATANADSAASPLPFRRLQIMAHQVTLIVQSLYCWIR